MVIHTDLEYQAVSARLELLDPYSQEAKTLERAIVIYEQKLFHSEQESDPNEPIP
jgi:hypothetical protein